MQVYSIEELRAKRRQGIIEEEIPYVVAGEMHTIKKKIVNGEMEIPELPAGEAMTFGSVSSLKDLTGKVALDVELGREKCRCCINRYTTPFKTATYRKCWTQSGRCMAQWCSPSTLRAKK